MQKNLSVVDQRKEESKKRKKMNFLQFLWTLKTVSSLHYESDFQQDKAAPNKQNNRTNTDIECLELEN